MHQQRKTSRIASRQEVLRPPLQHELSADRFTSSTPGASRGTAARGPECLQPEKFGPDGPLSGRLKMNGGENCSLLMC